MKKKNIVIVMVDAFRPKNLSLYGYDKEVDKNIKKVAEESLVFRDFFSSSNATAPSLTSLFTGRFVENHGVIHQFPYTSKEEILNLDLSKFWLPSFLQDNGYETAAVDWIGFWFKRGFTYYREKKEEEPNKFLNHPFVRRILLNLPSWAYSFGKKMVKARASPKFPTPKQTMDLAIKEMKDANDKGKPFFVFAHFWDTHFPFPTIDYKSSGEDDIKETLKKIKDPLVKEYFKKRITDIQLSSVDDMIGKYDAAISAIDSQIGRLYKFLKKSELWEDTVLIIMGDHGTNLVDHDIYFSSSSLFDDTIHVPFIMHLPGFSGEVKGFAQNVDIAPTLLEYLGLEKKEMDGVSMIPLIKDGKEIRDKVFSVDGLAGYIRSVRTEDRKLIVCDKPECNLCKSKHHDEKEEYDLEKDPGEKKNVYLKNSPLERFLKEEEKKEVPKFAGSDF